MKTITVNVSPFESSNTYTFDFDDLNITEEQWDNMGELERRDKIQAAVDCLPETPTWIVDDFEENPE